jgi:protein-arginine kinase activator protein McsA
MQSKLREAIESEEYERAAKIRDDIQKLTSDN